MTNPSQELSNQDQDAKLQSDNLHHQSPKSGLKGFGCSLHLLYQDREQNLEHGFIKDQ